MDLLNETAQKAVGANISTDASLLVFTGSTVNVSVLRLDGSGLNTSVVVPTGLMLESELDDPEILVLEGDEDEEDDDKDEEDEDDDEDEEATGLNDYSCAELFLDTLESITAGRTVGVLTTAAGFVLAVLNALVLLLTLLVLFVETIRVLVTDSITAGEIASGLELTVLTVVEVVVTFLVFLIGATMAASNATGSATT